MSEIVGSVIFSLRGVHYQSHAEKQQNCPGQHHDYPFAEQADHQHRRPDEDDQNVEVDQRNSTPHLAGAGRRCLMKSPTIAFTIASAIRHR